MKTLRKRGEFPIKHTDKKVMGSRIIRVTDAEAPGYIAEGWQYTSKKIYRKARLKL